MAKKTWIEKRDTDKTHIVKTIEKRFADMPEGCVMFIATPKIVDDYVRCIQVGNELDIPTMRNDLAIAINEAQKNNAKLEVTELVDKFYKDLQDMEGNRWDTSSLLKRLQEYD